MNYVISNTNIEEYNNSNISFKGKYIKNWVLNNRNSSDIDIAYMANKLYNSYYRYKHNNPNDKYFYYIINKNLDYEIRRDQILSFDKAIYITTNTMNDMMNNINKYLSMINKNPKFMQYDKEQLKNSKNVLEYRLNLLDYKGFTSDSFSSLNIYKRNQIYNIYKEYLSDIEVLSVNIF